MRRITISVFATLIALPAFADVRLPVVNLSSGGVSARAAFGETVATPTRTVASSVEKTETKPAAPTRRVVARGTVTKYTPAPVDTGEKIVASNDVLLPQRPSNDLWARAATDAPLRMPSPSEFAVFRSDSVLPEESLDGRAMAPTFAYDSTPVQTNVVKSEPMADIDAQIARLVELQRRVDETERSIARTSDRVIAAPIAAERTAAPTRTVVERAEPVVAPVEKIASAEPVEKTDDGVSLRRMVVPMEPDVIVRTVERVKSPRIASVRDDMSKMSPTELRRAFRKTFLSENKHLSTFQIDDRFDVASDMSSSVEGFTSRRDLSETTDVRPLEIKIRFRNEDSALTRDNYNLLAEYAAIVVHNPTRAIQIGIPQRSTTSSDARKLAARRLAIVEQVLRDTGVSQQRILPVLSQRDDDSFVLRVISNDQYDSLTQKKRDIFGDTIDTKSYKSMSW